MPTTSAAAPSTDPIVDPLGLEAWAQKTAPPGYYFDPVEAAKRAQFFPRYLRHTKGKWAGRPFELIGWQQAAIRVAFGWKRPDGTRRFRIVYTEVPRKNGKTELAAGVGVMLTTADGEAGAEVYSFASDTDQAAICHTEGKRMVAQHPALRGQCLVHKKAISVLRTSSSWKVLSSTSGNKDGLNAHGILGDEVHAVRDRALYELLHTSIGTRTQPLEWLITTAGSDMNTLCGDLHDYALKVWSGEIEDPEFLPIVYAAAAEDDWTSPATWAKANPSLGITITEEYLAKEAKRARELPRYENQFKRLHLNIWTEQVTRWLPMDRWDACELQALTADAAWARLAGRECWGGLDLSSTTDLTALALAAKRDDGGIDLALRFWLPLADLRERIRRDRVPYDRWIKDGWIAGTEGNVQDYDAVRRFVTGLPSESGTRVPALVDRVNLRELAYDSWNASQLATQLQGDGVTMAKFGQGYYSMSAPAKELERQVLAGGLKHGRNPVLRHMAKVVAVEGDAAGNIKPSKSKSTARIDGVVASVMAIARATVAGVDPAAALIASLKAHGIPAIG